MAALRGRSVLLTGGGSGLGLALVERYVEEGASVTVLDRAADRLARLEARFGTAVRTVTGDVTSPEANDEAVRVAVGAFGRLDVFVGNAGIWDFGRELVDLTPAEIAAGFDEIFGINVKGYLLGARAAVGALRETRGSMIFTLSNASLYPRGGGALYTAAKHAGVGLVRQLAYELAPEVRVNGIATGGMTSDLRGPASLGMADRTLADIPIQQYLREHSALRREVAAEDYTGTYVLLASARDAGTITGAVIDLSAVGTPPRP